jgi:2'-5' RNA ligase
MNLSLKQKTIHYTQEFVMNEIRTFIAIDLPPFVKDLIGRSIAQFDKTQHGTRWIKTENLHITLKFIGEHDTNLTEKIKNILDSIARVEQSFEIQISYTGAFPNKTNPRIIWQKIESQPPRDLINLQSSIENKLELIGIEREKRNFSSHLTIGRVRQPANLREFWMYEKKHPSPHITFKAKSFSLYQSILKQKGAQYTILENYSLQ